MSKLVVVINGRGGVGKDTLCDIVSEKYKTIVCSSIEPIKEVAKCLGWDENDKSDEARKFLSDLKMVSSGYNDYPMEYLIKSYNAFSIFHWVRVMFVHIREPEEIAKFKARVPECKTLLVKSKRTERDYGNVADDNVDNYDYDYVYHNDKPLDEVAEDFMKFFEEQILKGGST